MNDLTAFFLILIGLNFITLILLAFIFDYIRKGKDHDTPL